MRRVELHAPQARGMTLRGAAARERLRERAQLAGEAGRPGLQVRERLGELDFRGREVRSERELAEQARAAVRSEDALEALARVVARHRRNPVSRADFSLRLGALQQLF